jgi:NOL1/NOP2/fmu family ribosome biogenesis protein
MPTKAVICNTRKKIDAISGLEVIRWCEQGVYFNETHHFLSDINIYGGAYYVKSPSSMLIALMVAKIKSSVTCVLDVFGHLGSNTMLLSNILNQDAILVCNEINKPYTSTLKENINRWGRDNIIVSQNYLAEISKIEGYFDLIVVAIDHSNSLNLHQLFEQILPALKPEGYVIFTQTGTDFSDDFRSLSSDYELKTLNFNMDDFEQVTPNHHGEFLSFSVDTETDALFHACCLQKPYDDLARGGGLRKMKINYWHNKNRALISDWLKDDSNYDMIQIEDDIIAIPKGHTDEYAILNRYLNIQKVGVKLGKIVNNKTLIPDHELALYTEISDNISSISVPYEDANLYLSRKDFSITSAYLSGWQLVKYDGLALGWIKIIGNRMNNYYPKDIKFLKEF